MYRIQYTKCYDKLCDNTNQIVALTENEKKRTSQRGCQIQQTGSFLFLSVQPYVYQETVVLFIKIRYTEIGVNQCIMDFYAAMYPKGYRKRKERQGMENNMKILLIAINAKYIHSNLAVYSLRSYAKKHGIETQLAEYTINHRLEDILADIYSRKPDVAAFSCYIWNLEYVKALIADIHKILPETEIWAGGPEVSWDAEAFLEEMPQVRGIMAGEGEKTFCSLAHIYMEKEQYASEIERHDKQMEKGMYTADFEGCPGIIWRDKEGVLHQEQPQKLLPLDEVPFVYEDLGQFENRIIYYESSRGCPFSCSYCLSSIDKSVRFRSLALVEKELQFFLDHKVCQVKFVDRTFNCNHAHAMGIWRYIKEHDNGITNFHFEIAADLLNEEEIALLNTLRPGLAQLEIGVQSTNLHTIKEIDRVMDFERLAEVVKKVAAAENVHQHLDLIAGLPYEDFESFVHSFNDVYRLKPEQLQLGFLKVLKGSKMYRNAEKYGIVYHSHPMYEVISTKWISYGELVRLKSVEEMVEVYYNSAQFSRTIEVLEQEFESPFAMFEALADYYRQNGLDGLKHSRMGRLDILRDFILERTGGEAVSRKKEQYEALLLTDLYLRENSKSRPAWAPDLTAWKKQIQEFYKQEEEERRYLAHYEGYNWKQLMHMTHLEIRPDGKWYLFDYKKRSPLTKDAAITCVSIKNK